jgi:hypothetical protein
LKAGKPTIFHIAKYPPPIGTRVKVWFDTKERQLLVEDETGRVTYDIYGVPLTDVVFEAETTPRGTIRCQWFAKKLGDVLCPWLQAPCVGGSVIATVGETHQSDKYDLLIDATTGSPPDAAQVCS